MKFMVAGATTTIEELLGWEEVAPYLGAMVTPNTGNSLERVCSWKIPYVVDNAAFLAAKFSPERFLGLCEKVSRAPTRPNFVVVPDIVGDHRATLGLFWEWLPKMAHLHLPLAFVAQDGLGIYELRDEVPWDYIDAVFVGGTDELKDDMTGDIAEECNRRGKWCHVGRVNGRRRLRLAIHADADSVDGSSLSRFAKTWIPKFALDAVSLQAEAAQIDYRIAQFEEDINESLAPSGGAQ